MIIEKIKLKNWGPYRGEHECMLGPGIFAVIAKYEDDPERSNWGGKTWFLSAFKFALFGQRPARVRTEDDWITDGEDEGMVSLVLTRGVKITRSRKRGSSTVLVLDEGDGGATRKDAQLRIEEIIGMGKADYTNGCCIEQKQPDKLVLATPANLAKIVSDWLGLELLAKAADVVNQEFRIAVSGLRTVSSQLEYIRESMENIGDEESLVDERLKLIKERDKYSDEFDELKKKIASIGSWRKKAAEASRFYEIIGEGKELKREVDKAGNESEDEVDAELERATDIFYAKDTEYGKKKKLLKGFDGLCPIIGKECKVPGYVTENFEVTEDEVAEAYAERERLRIKREEIASKSREIGAIVEKKSRLDRLREEARSLKESAKFINKHGNPPDETEAAGMFASCSSEMERVKNDISMIEKNIQDVRRISMELVNLERDSEGLKDEISVRREAMFILGRDGAQKIISKNAVAAMENGANTMLAASGIDLSVSVQWAREGKDLARNCSDCGEVFPSSRKVKVCSSCGATRGQLIIEGLELTPSDSSGAADDLAGLAFQLAASSWLKSRSGSDWSVLCVDEPFAACDVANRAKLSRTLHAAIKQTFAYEQAFIVAHDGNAMESMPRTIRITRGDDGSRIEVV